ncbi:MAG: restriction endonuclease [Deltaproteobacteria bacterium]|nr:restriction endonuclease [Deltaproteobacteria bacterium]
MTLIETENISLSEWLNLLDQSPKGTIYVDYMFPTDRHREEYISTVHERSYAEVKQLLRRFLWLPTTFNEDKNKAAVLIQKLKEKECIKDKDTEFHRRVKLYIISRGKMPIWDGLRWVLDLLPASPRECLQTLEAYVGLYGYPLPEGRFHGIIDAMSVIRAKFIDTPVLGNEFESISDRQLELLVAELYGEMGYGVTVTKKTRDGGRDVIAERRDTGKLEKLLIEVKHHVNPIGVSKLRELLGVVSSEKVNKGVLITTSRFSKDAVIFAESNSRIEIIANSQLTKLLNEYLGTTWSKNLYLITSERFRKEKDFIEQA